MSWNAPNGCVSWFNVIAFAEWNAPKSKNFIFGSFSVWRLITCQFFEMLSNDKIIFRMLFGAFHNTPRLIKNYEIINKYLRAIRIIRSVVPLISFKIVDFCFDIAVRIIPRSCGHWWSTVIGQSISPIMITIGWWNIFKIMSVKTKKINYFKSIIVFQLTDGIVFDHDNRNTAKLFLPELRKCYRIQHKNQTANHLFVWPFDIQQFYFS